jgi:hypothetical protein
MKHIKLFEDYKPLSLGLVIVDCVDDNEEIDLEDFRRYITEYDTSTFDNRRELITYNTNV